MAIEFKCSTCGKDLFAGEQYAGMKTTCPAAKPKMIIPPPECPRWCASIAPAAISESAYALRHARQSVSRRYGNITPSASAQSALARNTLQVRPQRIPKRFVLSLRMETIKAAARKCRFCGEFFDDNSARRGGRGAADMAAAALQSAKRSDNVMRGASVMMTLLTAGWLLPDAGLHHAANVIPSFEIIFSAAWPLYLSPFC